MLLYCMNFTGACVYVCVLAWPAAVGVWRQVSAFLTSTEPVALAQYGLGAVALFYLAPPLLGAFFGGLRGFAGEITAAQALDLLGSDSNTVLINIRTEVGSDGSDSLHMAMRRSWVPH